MLESSKPNYAWLTLQYGITAALPHCRSASAVLEVARSLYSDIIVKNKVTMTKQSMLAIITDIEGRLRHERKLKSEYKMVERDLIKLKRSAEEASKKMDIKLKEQKEQIKQLMGIL
uniref:Uncharacterized protein n=1 Tax=Salarias fasciatus TaxID=181472 RepID=A0A672G820_SALFA